jgi:hypothetical protein
MQQPFKFAALCLVVCVVLIAILYAASDKPNAQKNGFNRKTTQTAVLNNSLALKYPAYYIAGYADQHIYLGNYSASLHLLTVHHNLKDTLESTLKIPPGERYAWKLARVMVDSPTVYMAEGNSPTLYRGRLDSLTLNRFLPQSCFFNLLQNISATSFISRSSHRDSLGDEQNILAKIKTDSPYVQLRKDILTKQVDGIFCTDGTLHFDKQSGKLVYLYHYRNEFITLDTNLQVIYTGHTLDTNTIAKIQVAKMSTGVSKFSAPPNFVNGNASIADNKIYVMSSLLADNENSQYWQQHDIIDVFSLDKGAYINTIYIPLQGKERITDFIVKDSQLFALYEHHLNAYSIIK